MGVIYNFLYAPLDTHVLRLEILKEVVDSLSDLSI